jgi:hypothetical protein
MTVAWTNYAQSLTPHPVKGMLTGPVTILQWSFVRNDQPWSLTCFQIALAIRDEVQDLGKAGIRIIQIDEPAGQGGACRFFTALFLLLLPPYPEQVRHARSQLHNPFIPISQSLYLKSNEGPFR